MKLHYSKRTALLNSLNCISSKDLTSLKDLSDGKYFANILSTIFNYPSTNVTENSISVIAPSEKDEIVDEESKTGSAVDNSVEKSSDTSSEFIDVCSVSPEKPCSQECIVQQSPACANANEMPSQECVIKPIESLHVINNKPILKRVKFIQNFIDERYNKKSDDMISYSKCIKANEFELAKVATLILSEVVVHFVFIKNDLLRTLSLLDIRIQEDLEECFQLCISERENISKKNLEKLLSNHAKYKSRSSSKNTFVTPRRNCVSKYMVDFTSTPVNEEVFSNSPLKSFFESPVFKKEDILLKEKEIAKTRKDLFEEEFKSEELQFELQKTKKLVEEKEKEIQKLKTTLQKESKDYEDELKQLQEDYNSLQKESNRKYKEFEKEISELFKENRFLKFEAKTAEGLKRYQNLDEAALIYEIMRRDALLGKRNENMLYYRLKQSTSFVDLDKMQSMLKDLTEELNAEKKKSQDIEIQAAKDREVYATKLSELKQAIKTEPEYPEYGENIGNVIEEENKILHLNLEDAYSKINLLEEKLQNMIHNVPNPKNAFNGSIAESLSLDLTSTPKRQKRISDKDDASLQEILDKPGTPNVKRNDSDKDKELNELPVQCDISSNFEVAYKNSPSSLHSEVVPSTKNTPEPPLEGYGSLWKNLDSSYTEIENTDSTACIKLNRPENCDKLPSKDLNLCPKCNISNKNGYNRNAIDLERSMKMAQELGKKEEEIDKLKANYKTLEQQTEAYMEKLCEKDKENEELKLRLKESERRFKDYYLRYKLMMQRFSEKNELKEKSVQYPRTVSMTNLEILTKKCEISHKKDIESLKRAGRMKDHEINTLKTLLISMSKEKKNLMKKIKSLQEDIHTVKNEKLEILKKLKETEKYYSIKLLCKNNLQNMKVAAGITELLACNDSNADASKDLNNESSMSCALNRRNGISIDNFPMNEDEDSFLNHTYLPRPEDDERLMELIMRNLKLPLHLRSVYPLELDLNHSNASFFINQTETVLAVASANPATVESAPKESKKRKHEESDCESSEVAASTPISRLKKKCASPFVSLMSFSRNRRNGSIKPKP